MVGFLFYSIFIIKEFVMKKYIITENQLKVILERADDTPENYSDVPPMSFDNFLKAIEKDNNKNGTSSNRSDDIKSFALGAVAGNRAEYNIDKSDSALKAIAGKFYKSINAGYGINPDDGVLAESEDLCIIIMCMAYYYYKEGSIKSFNVRDVDLDFRKNYNELKRTNLSDIRGLLRTKFDADIFGRQDDDDENQIIVAPRGDNPSFQVYINKNSRRTTMVRFNFFDSTSLNFFYNDFLKNDKNINLISKAINRRVRPRLDNGSLVFQF